MPGDGMRDTIAALWSPLLAVTTTHEGHANGQIAVAGLSASILPEAPRVLVGLWKANYTHELILASRIFALHLLAATPEQSLTTSLLLIRQLGFRTGRDGDKLTGIAWHAGTTGSPVLEDALMYVECRVTATLDSGEMTLFLGDVVVGERLYPGAPLSWSQARGAMPPEWLAEYDANQERQRAEARRWRGLPA